jgi:hypothetical protein
LAKPGDIELFQSSPMRMRRTWLITPQFSPEEIQATNESLVQSLVSSFGRCWIFVYWHRNGHAKPTTRPGKTVINTVTHGFEQSTMLWTAKLTDCLSNAIASAADAGGREILHCVAENLDLLGFGPLGCWNSAGDGENRHRIQKCEQRNAR